MNKLEEILNYETDLEDLEQLSEELEEMSYYNYTNKQILMVTNYTLTTKT